MRGVGLLVGLLCLLAAPARSAEIAVAQYDNAVNAFPYAVALDKKFFQQAGADITAVIGSNGGGGDVRNLLAGELPYVETALPPVIAAIQKGADLAIVSDNVLSAASFAIVAMADSPVSSIRDLKGKRVGFSTAQSTTQAFEIWIMDRAGYKPGDVTLLATGGFGPGLTALENKGIDATVGILPAILSNPGKYKVIVRGKDALPPICNTVGVVLRSKARENPALVRSIIAGRRLAVAYMLAHRADSAAIIAKVFKLTPAVVEEAIHQLNDEGIVDGVPYWGDGHIHYPGIDNMIHAARLNGMVQGDIDPHSVVDESYLPEDLRSKTP